MDIATTYPWKLKWSWTLSFYVYSLERPALNSAFWYIYIYIWIYIDIQKYIQVFILLITVHNKAILTVTIIQAQNFASSRKYTLFVQISHTNKALIPPQILVWGQREVLGYLSETSICPGALTEQQFGVAFQSSRCEPGSAESCMKVQSPPSPQQIYFCTLCTAGQLWRHRLAVRAQICFTKGISWIDMCVSYLQMKLLSHQQAMSELQRARYNLTQTFVYR